MLDAFEARLADVLADRLAGVPGLGAPLREAPAEPPAAGARPVLRVLEFAPEPLFGDDAPRPPPGLPGPRRALALSGVLGVELAAAPGLSRGAYLAALDAVLLAFQAEDLRRGQALSTGADQGFVLHGLRFLRAAREEGLPPGRPRLLFAFEGLFWARQAEAEGPAIAEIPTRLVALPARLPERLSAQAGAGPLVIPLRLDLVRRGAAPGLLQARLRGASPPGALEGDAPGAPEGFAGFALDARGEARLVFRPPASLDAPARAEIELRLHGVPVGHLAVELRP